MRKTRIMSLFIIFSFLIMIGNISAFNDSIGPVRQEGSTVKLNGSDILALKYYDSTAVFCTQFANQTLPSTGLTCSKTDNWSDAVKAGVGSIIDKVGTVGISGDAPSNYYYGELAINEFLCDSGIDTNYTCRVTNLGSYNSWYTEAKSVRDNYKEASLSFSTKSLTFTLSGDNYVSNTIKVTKSFDDNYQVTSNVGRVVQNGDDFYVSVPVSSISNGDTLSVTVNASISKSVKMAQNYSCGSAQSVTPNLTETKTLSASETASGTISVDKTRLVINKVDNNNVGVKGATITVTGPNNYSKEFVTDGNPIVIEDLEFGEYVITETKAPDGYYGSTEANKVVLSASKMEETVTIKNNLTETIIDKVSAVDGKELKGATLQILNNKKEKISCTILDEKGNKKILDECMWISTDKPTTVVGLPIGKYYLKEVIAPEGYVLSDKMVQFEVKSNGKKTEVKMTNELEVEVPNTLSTRSALLLTIAMFDIALGIGMLIYVKKNKNKE